MDDIKKGDRVIYLPKKTLWKVVDVDYCYGPEPKYLIEQRTSVFSGWVDAKDVEKHNPKFRIGDEVRDVGSSNAHGDDIFAIESVTADEGLSTYFYTINNGRTQIYEECLELASENENAVKQTEMCVRESDDADRELMKHLFNELLGPLERYHARLDVKDGKLRLRMKIGEREIRFSGPKELRRITHWSAFKREDN